MGRAPRVRADDVVYHVTARGVRRLRVYEDAFDYRKFEALLARVVLAREWAAYSYCQMPNHYHLVLSTPNADISDGLCWLNGVYARWFNRRHGYSGHLFEARFHSELVLSNAHLLNTARYVPRNPVRAGLCTNPAEWRWSSYRATVGLERKPWLSSSLLDQFGRGEARAVAEYRRFVETAVSA
jgi:putative transposase